MGMGALALIVLFCSFAHLACSRVNHLPPPLLDLDDMPPTIQADQRVLTAITATSIERKPLIQKILHAYADMCEMGYEVHVVFVSFHVWADEKDNPFQPWSLYHCKRLEQDLPVAATLWHHTDRRLAGRHREIFAAFAEKYDYFISQEEDIAIRPSHMSYFSRWLKHFQAHPGPVPVIPGFTLYEVFTGQFGEEQAPAAQAAALPATHDKALPVVILNGINGSPSPPNPPSPPPPPRPPSPFAGPPHHPMVLIHKSHEVWETFMINNVTVVMPHKMYPAMYIVPQNILKQAIARPSWRLDVLAPWREYNVHFQHHWLMRHVRMAIPLVAFKQSLIHHGSDKYHHGHIWASGRFGDGDSHANAMEVSELQSFLHRCTGAPAAATRHARLAQQHAQNAVINYKVHDNRLAADSQEPCAACLQQGLGARFLVRMWGPSPVYNMTGPDPKPPLHMTADIACVDGMAQQQVEGCDTPGRCGPGEHGGRRMLQLRGPR